MKQYKYNIAVCASRLYPMKIHRGSFLDSKGNFTSVGAGATRYANGWGSLGGTMNSTEMRTIPKELSLIWFSFVEAKFYAGNFPLPEEKLKALFEKKWIIESPYKRYVDIVIGMAPGGIVVVWVSEGGSKKEVARFYGEPIDISMREFVPMNESITLKEYADLREYSHYDHVYANIEKHGIQTTLFEEYRKKYKMKLRFDFEEQSNLDYYSCDYVNGERDISEADDRHSDFTPTPRIKRFILRWSVRNESGEIDKYTLRLLLNANETIDAYNEMFGDNPDKNVELITKIGKYNNEFEFFLTDGKKRVEFKESSIKHAVFKNGKFYYKTENYPHGQSRVSWDEYSD